MRKLLVTLYALCFAGGVHAAPGYLVQGATITKVSSTSNNVDAFWVYYEGGQSDKCNGQVKFLASKAGTNGVFERTFSLAMSALVAQKTIEIYSYSSTSDCQSAVSINMLR